MPFIKTFAIDSAGPYVVTAQKWCRRIEVRENYDQGTPPQCDLQQFNPGSTTNPALIAKGTPAEFSDIGAYNEGQEAGRINTASGSCTVVQIEYGR